MKMQRRKNATRNIAFGIIYRLVATLGPFAIRTVLLYVLGAEYLGLNSLFTSLLSFLSLAELGVGSAMVYAMYKPIAEDDKETLSALLNLYRRLYRIIGVVILGIGVVLLPFIGHLVNGTVPDDINLYILYIIYLLNTVISYFLFGYKQSLLIAYHRRDIVSKRSTIVQLSMYGCQILVLLISKQYYLYIILLPIFTIVTNLANSVIVDRLYPDIKCRGKVSDETGHQIRRNVLALIGGKLSNTVLHSSDNLVISIFIGLVAVAIYGNYFYIINAVCGFTEVIYASITAGLGNSIIIESREKNFGDFKMLSMMNSWLVCWCCTCFLCLLQPFMLIWTGESMMYPFSMVILFVIYFYLYQINKIVLTYKDAAGVWWQDRFRPYVVMGTNLVLNIILIQYIGIYGVILSTIISLIISIPWSTYTVFKYIFQRSRGKYNWQFIKNIIVTIIACGVTYLIGDMISGGKYFVFLIRLLICLVIPNVIFILFNFKSPDFVKTIKYARSALAERRKS